MVLTPQPALRTVLPLIKTLINKYFNREWEGWGICPRLETQLRIVQPCDQLWNTSQAEQGQWTSLLEQTTQLMNLGLAAGL